MELRDLPALTARLLITCADRRGIVAAVASFLAARDGNIVESDQHATGPPDERFAMRMVVDVPGATDLDEVRAAFSAEVAAPMDMRWRLTPATERRRIAVLASREPHCLLDLLWRWRSGELPGDVACVVSNHDVHRASVEALGLPYLHVPVTPATKPDAERALLDHLREHAVDLVVLARYMQVLSSTLLADAGVPFINIHHSFLPAFAGADPYRRAFERGVKIIGATAHYVTEELDEGPIIEQDVARITHRADVADLARAGADLERVVLARAVRWHLEDRVIVTGRRTVVF